MPMAAEILLELALLLLVAKLLGYVFQQLGLSRLVGEIAAGILLGPIFMVVQPDPLLGELANLGILFFLFLIGLSVKAEEFKHNIYAASAIAVAGSLFSLGVGYLIGVAATGDPGLAAIIGIGLMSTSTAISLRSVSEIGQLHTRAGRTVIAVNMADEIAALLALSIVGTISLGTINIAALFTLFLTILGFIYLILTVGIKVVGHILDLAYKIVDNEIFLTVPIALVFIIAFVSEQIGIAAVTGAFLAGMTMAKSNFTEKSIIPKVNTIGHGFFIPLFFSYSAIQFSFAGIGQYAGLIIVLVMGGALAKVIGCGFASRKLRYSKTESALIGFSMIPRGEYTIIIAQTVLAAGLITTSIYSALLSFVILTIIITPMMMKIFFRR